MGCLYKLYFYPWMSQEWNGMGFWKSALVFLDNQPTKILRREYEKHVTDALENRRRVIVTQCCWKFAVRGISKRLSHLLSLPLIKVIIDSLPSRTESIFSFVNPINVCFIQSAALYKFLAFLDHGVYFRFIGLHFFNKELQKPRNKR